MKPLLATINKAAGGRQSPGHEATLANLEANQDHARIGFIT